MIDHLLMTRDITWLKDISETGRVYIINNLLFQNEKRVSFSEGTINAFLQKDRKHDGCH